MREVKRQILVLLAVLLPSFLLLNSLGLVVNASPTITEYPVPPSNSGSADTTFITNGPDGNVWFTQSLENDIGSISPGGSVNIYTGLDQNTNVNQITSGPDGALWFTQGSKNTAIYGSNIGRIDTSGSITEFPLHSQYYVSYGITTGPDGALWFSEWGSGIAAIGRMTTSGQITDYPIANSIPLNGDFVLSIVSGPDGSLWFTDSSNSSIFKMSTSGTMTQYSTSTPNSDPDGIALGSDNALWFTEGSVNKIGRITTDGSITEYTITSQNTPGLISSGPDGNLWFTEPSASSVASISTNGVITEYSVPTANSNPIGITTGPGGVWFAESYANNIGFISTESDNIPPNIGAIAWSANPLSVGGDTTLTVPANDSGSGVANGEYYLGTTDPGQGNGTSMTYNNGKLTATFGSNLTSGIYTVNVRARDNAGNWSSITTDYLVVYNPTSGGISGHSNTMLPVYGADVLPGLIQSGQTDMANFALTTKYDNNGNITTNSKLKFSYSTGSHCNNASQAMNCHSLTLDSTSIAWLVISGTNNSQGTIQGSATLTVDGVTTTNPFTVVGIDGALLNPQSSDTFTINIYAPGANPNTATPIYHLNVNIVKGSIKIS